MTVKIEIKRVTKTTYGEASDGTAPFPKTVEDTVTVEVSEDIASELGQPDIRSMVEKLFSVFKKDVQ
jgi:hypothetical protein